MVQYGLYCLSLIVCSWPLVKLCETSLSTSDHHCPLCYFFLFRHCNPFLSNHEQLSEDDLQFRTSIAMPNPCQSIYNDFHPNLILQNLISKLKFDHHKSVLLVDLQFCQSALYRTSFSIRTSKFPKFISCHGFQISPRSGTCRSHSGFCQSFG